MSTFAPVYRPTKHQQSFILRQQRVDNKKRKRDIDSDDDDNVRGSTPDRPAATPTTAFHPINKTDPYYVAGHPRELPLPLLPFPHAAVEEPSEPKRPIEEELAGLNPPLYVPSARLDDKSTSLKRRHLDNVTTILHRCMLKGDWQRAFRAWSLLIRTEIHGHGTDVRRNGRWGIGAELLMRRGDLQSTEGSRLPLSNRDDAERPSFTSAGFKLARDYYERLILQYPHTARTMHSVNATAIYPALFNVWIYEVQDRSKAARARLRTAESNRDTSDDDLTSNASMRSGHRSERHRIRTEELEQARPIAQRMDELFLSPPYDTMSDLRRLRDMVARWISDIQAELPGLLGGILFPEEDESEHLNETRGQM